MLPPNLSPNLSGDKNQRRLLKLYNGLDSAGQKSLLDFAEFLASRGTPAAFSEESVVTEPELIPRPENESVVAAIKRLSKSYSMLNRDALLHETSDLMSSHIIKGRPAPEVIDDLELLFVSHYKRHTGVTKDDE